MAQKVMYDQKDTGKFHGLPMSDTSPVVELMNEYEDIFDVLAQNGLNPFEINDYSNIKGVRMNDDQPHASYYTFYQRSHFGLLGEYNTQVGVKLYNFSIRSIDFLTTGKEEAYQAVDYDPIVDAGQKERMASFANEDYAKSRKEQREIKYMEQVINSGVQLTDAASYTDFYTAVGFGTFPAPADVDNFTPDEMEYFCLAVEEYYKIKKIDKMPIIFVKPSEWAAIVKSPEFQSIIHTDTRNKELIQSDIIGIIHGCQLVKFRKLAKPNSIYQDVHRIVITPGNAHLLTEELHDLKWRPYYEAKLINGNKVMDAEFYSGSYMEMLFMVDNLKLPNGDMILSELNIVCGAGLVQDMSVLIFGQVRGEAPTSKEAVNRTLQQVVKSNYDNSYGDYEQTPPTSDGSYVVGTAPGDGAENGETILPLNTKTAPVIPPVTSEAKVDTKPKAKHK